jgi:hypothetical protein
LSKRSPCWFAPWSSARGRRLFPDTGPEAALELGGIAVHHGPQSAVDGATVRAPSAILLVVIVRFGRLQRPDANGATGSFHETASIQHLAW